ncbi:hypothetical protein G6F37_003124 [Rhizopus arrhizus]|nr:hypothetical protein G6F38_007398 [Rhizopus arrhizus]KAG1161386.1 hypothetical protein G6F37_003124 [Rhizopus arrhizus]
MNSLTREQRETLSQYQTITKTKVDEALSQLIKYNWDLQRATDHKFETSRSSQRVPAVRSERRPFRFSSILFWPFGLAWNITWSLLSFASYDFKQVFESRYGSSHVDFFQAGYNQALEKAKNESRLLLVILQSDDHDQTGLFCRETLTSKCLIDYTREKNILIWGGNVKESESHKVSLSLKATRYPFSALIGLKDRKMTVIERLEGYQSAEEMKAKLDSVIQKLGETTIDTEREKERRLREEQDMAYLKSLRADQEKTRKIKKEREEEEKREREREEEEEKRERYVLYLFSQFPQEPKEGKLTRLNFRLPNGERMVRSFSEDDNLDTLYQFIEIYPLLKSNNHKMNDIKPKDYIHKYTFKIHNSYPRIQYEPNKDIKLATIPSLWPSATLVIDDE